MIDIWFIRDTQLIKAVKLNILDNRQKKHIIRNMARTSIKQ